MGNGNCYSKQGLCLLNNSEIDVFDSGEKKDNDPKREKTKKIDADDTLTNHLQKRRSSIRKVQFLEDKQNEEKKEKKNNNENIKRRVKQKVIMSVKSPQELMQINKLKFHINNNNNNDDSICEDKNSILNFNSVSGSEISQSNIILSPKKKFKRKNKRSITGIDKSNLNKKLINLEKSIPVLTETLIIQQKGNLHENYEIIKKIGAGSLGVVYKAKNIYLKNIVAIKMIKKVKENDEEDLKIINQINILKKLSHPNIVKIHEFYSNKKYYQIITEYCKKGELFKYIKRSFTEKQLAVIFYQILSGLNYLHEKNVIHKNIKLKNIMVLQKEEDINSKEEYLWIKIIDFHTAEIFQKNRKDYSHIHNSYYTSPEAIKNIYTEKSDIWSVGIILHLALTGKVPFDGKTDDEINYKIENISYNELDPRLLAHSSESKDLLDKLLQKDQKNRPSAKEALNHEWFKKYGGRSLFCNFRPDEIQQYINNLCTYSCSSKITQLVLAFLVHNIPVSTSTYIILKLFRYFNLSGDCKLTKTELKKGLYNYRNEEQVNNIVDELFLLLDGDNNGYIEFEEFYRACVDKGQILTKENIWYAFKFLDDKNTNTIDVKTLMRAFDTKPNKMIEAVFNKTLNKGDFDNNGIITFQEFEEIMLNTLND